MVNKNKYILLSFVLFVIFLITWLVTGTLAEKTSEMDTVTSMAIFSFLGTVLFLVITLVFLLFASVSKYKSSKL